MHARLATVLIVVIGLVTLGCSASEQVQGDAGQPQDGGTLVVGVYQETSGWNPTYDRWAQMGALVGSSVLEPLAAIDAEGRAQPWLATSWEPNATFTSWTVNLREGVQFHDGTPFDATAVKANIDDNMTSILSSFATGKLLLSATVLGPHAVRIDLQTPWSAFPVAFLASQGAMQRSPTSLADGTASSHPVGTGPFRFDGWKRDDRFEVARNPTYWRPGEPHLERIEFRVITEDGARASALRANDVDMIFTVTAKDAADLEADHTVIRDWDTEQTMLVANTRPMVGEHVNPMGNLHGRRAIAMATDRQVLADLVGEGVQLFSGPFAPGSPWGQPEAQSEYPGHDQQGARAEVAAYLEQSGQRAMEVQVLGAADTATISVLQALQAMWAEVGITATIKTADATAFNQRLIGSDYDLALTAPYSAPDPDQDFVFWAADNIGEHGRLSINFSGFTSMATEQAMLASRATDDAARRHELYNQLVRELNRNVTTIWLYASPFSLIAGARVHGLEGAGEVPFANYQPKCWWGRVSLAH